MVAILKDYVSTPIHTYDTQKFIIYLNTQKFIFNFNFFWPGKDVMNVLNAIFERINKESFEILSKDD